MQVAKSGVINKKQHLEKFQKFQENLILNRSIQSCLIYFFSEYFFFQNINFSFGSCKNKFFSISTLSLQPGRLFFVFKKNSASFFITALKVFRKQLITWKKFSGTKIIFFRGRKYFKLGGNTVRI